MGVHFRDAFLHGDESLHPRVEILGITLLALDAQFRSTRRVGHEGTRVGLVLLAAEHYVGVFRS